MTLDSAIRTIAFPSRPRRKSLTRYKSRLTKGVPKWKPLWNRPKRTFPVWTGSWSMKNTSGAEKRRNHLKPPRKPTVCCPKRKARDKPTTPRSSSRATTPICKKRRGRCGNRCLHSPSSRSSGRILSALSSRSSLRLFRIRCLRMVLMCCWMKRSFPRASR